MNSGIRPSRMGPGSVDFRPYELGPLRTHHLPQALELSRALQWPYRLEDWEFAFKLGRGFAVEIGGRLAGTALWWPYGDRYASAGMIIVAADAQRMGIGHALMEALLAETAGRTVILNSTREGFNLYKRLGFVIRGEVVQHQAVLARAPVAAEVEAVRAFRAGDLEPIRDLDRAASGMERGGLIDALFAVAKAIVIQRGRQLSGYALARTWGRGTVIGPVVAADAGDAAALVAALARPLVGQFVRIDVTADSELSPWLESIGLPQVNKVTAMTLGDPPQFGRCPKLFALSNQSLG